MRKKNRQRTPSRRSRDGINKFVQGSNQAKEETHAEAIYLMGLIREKKQIIVKLLNNQEIKGRIEYYDNRFIRLTPILLPNLFIYKNQIKYIVEA